MRTPNQLEESEREARWQAVGKRERADRVLLRARLTDLVRAGERARREDMPTVGPLVAVIDRLRRTGGGTDAGLHLAIEMLDEDPGLREGVRGYSAALMRASRTSSALADLGILPVHGFLAELRARLVRNVLPPHRAPDDMLVILDAIVSSRVDLGWISRVDDVALGRLLQLVEPNEIRARQSATLNTLRAIDVLAHRLAAAGEDPSLDGFNQDAKRHESPFLAGARLILNATESRRAAIRGDSMTPGAPDEDHSRVLLSQCRETIIGIRKRTPRTGATLRLGYDLERMHDIVDRLILLLDALTHHDERVWQTRGRLVRELIHARREASDIMPVLRRATRLAASEIVTHSSRTGEHYIPKSPDDYGHVWLSAAGAGAIVAIVAILKLGLKELHAPILVEAGLFSINYIFGLVTMQAFGFTLATKQPPATSATLASALSVTKSRHRKPIYDIVKHLVVGQVLAIGGNVLVAMPLALLVAAIVRSVTGHPLTPRSTAEHFVEELDLLNSGAIPHAALTGVCLSFSGIIAGYVASVVSALHFSERIRRSPLRARWGGTITDWLATASDKRIGGIAGSIALGLLLGSTGPFGAMLGLPLETRHVSFSSANVGLALGTLSAADVRLPYTLLGLVVVGVVNLVVSFAISLAFHARHRREQPRRRAATGA